VRVGWRRFGGRVSGGKLACPVVHSGGGRGSAAVDLGGNGPLHGDDHRAHTCRFGAPGGTPVVEFCVLVRCELPTHVSAALSPASARV
jgi:hypothetical protein